MDTQLETPLDRSTLRRAPTQARGWRRVNRILDAAAAEFADVGYDNATTNSIADRADTSIGSLYQFFPNKEAILHALNARYLQQLRAVCDEVLSPEPSDRPLAGAIDEIVEGLARFHAQHPGFQSVFYGSHGSSELSEAAQAVTAEIIGRLEAMMAARRPDLSEARRQLLSTVAMETMKALLVLSVAHDEPWRRNVTSEAKRLLYRYLAPEIEANEDDR